LNFTQSESATNQNGGLRLKLQGTQVMAWGAKEVIHSIPTLFTILDEITVMGTYNYNVQMIGFTFKVSI
jgi:hypothetical protein